MNKSGTSSIATTCERKFFLFGDSICFGQLVSPHRTWVSRLAELLLNVLGEGILVQNSSINGSTTRQALERMAYDVTSHHPDFLLVQFGMNDCNYWETDISLPRVSQAAFSANLLEIGDRALASGTKHLFLNTNHPSLKGAFHHLPQLTHSASNGEYNDIIRNACELMKSRGMPVTLIDIEAAWNRFLSRQRTLKLEHLLLKDGIHLSLKGHDLYFDIVSPIVAKELGVNV